ncbi:MAG: hypothetical protein F6K14_27860 [Symploca sp. SIO2C1]|nr:hypothetical protein [Symploca sp. SIO2C1]
MSELHLPVETAVDNEKSLKDLAWAIDISEGQTSLILVRCNHPTVQQQMVQRLRVLCPDIQEIVLAPSVNKLYSTIREQVGDDEPPALMVLGLDSVSDINQLLISLNSVREEFRKHCRFPLVLWVNDEIMRKFIRLAPDFESWTTRTQFASIPDTVSNSKN